MSKSKDGYHIGSTLCWDCANYCGGCSWSAQFVPVKGWVAEPTVKFGQSERPIQSYRVYDCPEFIRDSFGLSGVISKWLPNRGVVKEDGE